MDTFQCPGCVLRFRHASELMLHIEQGHPHIEINPRSIEDALMSAAHKHRHRYLKVGPERNSG